MLERWPQLMPASRAESPHVRLQLLLRMVGVHDEIGKRCEHQVLVQGVMLILVTDSRTAHARSDTA